jgi:hypothetical protein
MMAVATMYSDYYKPLADITVNRNHRAYCAMRGYVLEIHTEPFSIARDPGFERIAFIVDVLKSGKYEWVLWLGADTLVTNLGLRIEDKIVKGMNLIVSRDLQHINTDVLLIKVCRENIEWFSSVAKASLDKKYRYGWREQRAMIDRWTAPWASKFKVMPQRHMNAYLYNSPFYPNFQGKREFINHQGQWHPGDWIMHWPSMKLPDKIVTAKQYIQEVVN